MSNLLYLLRTEKEIIQELGKLIKEHRKEIKLSQIDMAKRSGVSRSTIQKIESGENINLKDFLKILRQIDVLSNVDNIFYPEGRW